MSKVVIVDTNGAICVKNAPKNMDCFWMAKEIGCDWIEIVRPKNLARGYVMIVDEEGLLRGKIINVAGSHLYGTVEHGSPVVGDIMIVREVMGDEGPELAGMEPETANEIARDLGNPLHLMEWEEEILAKLHLARIFRP